MRELSEYKLLGYYLIKLYEKSEISQLKYEQIKLFTQNVFTHLGKNHIYSLLPIEEKMAIVKSMINRGMFATKIVNGKSTFSQKYNYEIAKYIYVTYSYDGSLTFKLAKEIIDGNKATLDFAKKIYATGIDLNLQAAVKAELTKNTSKSGKNKTPA